MKLTPARVPVQSRSPQAFLSWVAWFCTQQTGPWSLALQGSFVGSSMGPRRRAPAIVPEMGNRGTQTGPRLSGVGHGAEGTCGAAELGPERVCRGLGAWRPCRGRTCRHVGSLGRDPARAWGPELRGPERHSDSPCGPDVQTP